MGFPIELIGKELLNGAIAKLAGWQADGVNHNQIDLGAVRALTKVGRLAFFGALVPALLPNTQVHVDELGADLYSAIACGLAMCFGAIWTCLALEHVGLRHVQAAVTASQHGAGLQRGLAV